MGGGHAARRLFRDAWVHQTKGAHDGQDEEPVRVRKGEGRRGVQRPVRGARGSGIGRSRLLHRPGYNGDTMDGHSLLEVVSDIEDSLEGM